MYQYSLYEGWKTIPDFIGDLSLENYKVKLANAGYYPDPCMCFAFSGCINLSGLRVYVHCAKEKKNQHYLMVFQFDQKERPLEIVDIADLPSLLNALDEFSNLFK